MLRYIFLIQRKSGEILVLHPFRAGDDLFTNPENLVLEGRYATEPASGKVDALRSVLHLELEKGARSDAADRGFYPRLFVSAAVFIVLYLFLSIVIRDPVPLVDELLVGGLGAFACWSILERRALSSPDFTRRVAELRKILDSVLFQSSRVVRSLEESLQDAETLDPERYEDFLTQSPGFTASPEERMELQAFADALKARLPAEAVEGIRRRSPAVYGPEASVGKFAGRKRLDVPVLLSYARVLFLLEENR